MLLFSRREIVGGPGLNKFMMTVIDGAKIVFFEVRGVGSKCACPYDNSCDNCGKATDVAASLLGRFVAPQGGVIWWGIVGNFSAVSRARKEYAADKPIGDNAQFVYAYYDPTSTVRDWMAPCKLPPKGHFIALYTDSLVRSGATYGDLAKGEIPRRRD